MTQPTINVLVFTPDPRAESEVRAVDNALDGLRAVIDGGHLEAVSLAFALGACVDPALTVVCDEDGIAKGLPLQRAGLRGVFFVCRTDGEDFASLTADDVERVRTHFP